MDEAEFNAIVKVIGEEFTETYVEFSESGIPKPLILVAMIGALASCAFEAELARDNVIAGLNSSFDDIEAGEKKDSK